MKILQIGSTLLDYPSNMDFAVIVYYAGCDLRCPGCHNPGSRIHGEPNYTVESLIKAIREKAKQNRTNKLVLSGGDPLSIQNFSRTQAVLDVLKDEFDIIIYTGQTYAEVQRKGNIKGHTYLKCGPYLEEQSVTPEKVSGYFQLASTNQTFHDSSGNCISENGRMYFK